MSDDFRKRHVGGSEVAALFDEHPNLTHFELWHRKAGNIAESEFAGTERSQWGVALEPAIIDEACRRETWTLADKPEFVSNGRGLGGHPDAHVLIGEARATLECKCVDRLIVRGWGDEPPMNYLLQVQTYMGLAGHDSGVLVALVGGNELRIWHYDFRPRLFAEIERRVENFWRSVEQGDPPAPDFAADGRVIGELYGHGDGGHVDLTGDNYAAVLAQRFLSAKTDEKEARERAEAAKAELVQKIGNASTARLDGFALTARRTKDTAPTLITAAMVGTTYGGRNGCRRFEVREISQ